MLFIISLLMVEMAAKMRRGYHSYHDREDYHASRNVRRHTRRQLRHRYYEHKRRHVERRRRHKRARSSRRMKERHYYRSSKRSSPHNKHRKHLRKLQWQNVQNPSLQNVDYDLKTYYKGVFTNFTSFCIDRDKSCQNNCKKDYCDIQPQSLYCIRCVDNCINAAYNPCEGFRSENFKPQQKLYDTFFKNFTENNIDRCEYYDKRYCPRSCKKHYCDAYPQSQECTLCSSECNNVGKKICETDQYKTETSNREIAIRQNFNITYNNTFFNTPLLSKVSVDFCTADCNNNYCYIDPEAFRCKACGDMCNKIALNYAEKAESFNATASKYFKEFFDESHKCIRLHREVISLCSLSICTETDPYNPNCIICVQSGLIGANQACSVKIRKDTRLQEIFTGVAKVFQKNPMACSQCDQSNIINPVCSNYCFQDITCANNCSEPAQVACTSMCVGEKGQYYLSKFNPKMTEQFNKRKETCDTCVSYCEMDWIRFCYEGDAACRQEWNTTCTEGCNIRFCSIYRARVEQLAENLKNSKNLYQQRLILSLQRQKRRQSLRLDYDDKRNQKIQELALNLQRNAIFDSIKLMEGDIYVNQRTLAEQAKKKDDDYSQDLMKKIYAAYTTEEMLKKTLDAGLKIFED